MKPTRRQLPDRLKAELQTDRRSGEPLEQFLNQRLGLILRYPKLTVGQRAAFREDGFQILEGGKISAFPEKADWDFFAPLIPLVESSVEIRGIVLLVFEGFDARREPLIGVVLIVCDAGAEDIHQSKTSVIDGAFDQVD